jgi:hypothetical protein
MLIGSCCKVVLKSERLVTTSYGILAGLLFATPDAIGAMVGVAAPRISVTVLLPEFAIHKFPEPSIEIDVGVLSGGVAEPGVVPV